jgi:hypothetical protein
LIGEQENQHDQDTYPKDTLLLLCHINVAPADAPELITDAQLDRCPWTPPPINQTNATISIKTRRNLPNASFTPARIATMPVPTRITIAAGILSMSKLLQSLKYIPVCSLETHNNQQYSQDDKQYRQRIHDTGLFHVTSDE